MDLESRGQGVGGWVAKARRWERGEGAARRKGKGEEQRGGWEETASPRLACLFCAWWRCCRADQSSCATEDSTAAMQFTTIETHAVRQETPRSKPVALTWQFLKRCRRCVPRHVSAHFFCRLRSEWTGFSHSEISNLKLLSSPTVDVRLPPILPSFPRRASPWNSFQCVTRSPKHGGRLHLLGSSAQPSIPSHSGSAILNRGPCSFPVSSSCPARSHCQSSCVSSRYWVDRFCPSKQASRTGHHPHCGSHTLVLSENHVTNPSTGLRRPALRT